MGIVNKRVFNKAYMLEFLGEEKPIIFTFSIPPKGEDFDFGQRVTETKTFGGSIFDNYGNDTIKINLSGSTGNTDKKLIYRGLKMPLYLSGEAEIFELQKTIYNWHKITSKNANKDKKVYLYDLSKMNIMEFATLKPSRNYWRVYVKDLKIKRDDSKPFTFNYTLEMYGLAEEQEKKSFSFDDLSSVVQGFTNAMNVVQTVMDYTEGALAAVEELTNTITKVKNAYDAFQTMSDKGKVLSIFKGIDSSTRILTGNTNNTFYNSAKSCLSVYGQVKSLFSGDTTDTQSSKTTDSSKFRVMFNSNGGSDVKTQNVEFSQRATKPSNPTKENYTFVNWYSDSACTVLYDFSTEVTSSFTLYAKWQLAIATVTFNSKGGSSVIKQQVAIGNCATTPTAPTKTGFSFVYWCTDYAATIPFDFTTPITDNMTLYAAWQTVYSVVFNSNGGTDVETQIVTTGEKAIYPITPTKENYTFSKWCSDSELTTPFDFSTVITADTTLYAQWIQYSNTVTFDSNGGSAVESQNVHIGGNATEPTAPTKTGFSFVYWCTDSACTNEFHFNSTAVNAPLTLYAKWSAVEITVTFDSNGGSAVDSQTVAYNGKAIFPTIPTKENDLFLMWQKKTVVELEDVYSEYDFNTTLTENITLYAKWFED